MTDSPQAQDAPVEAEQIVETLAHWLAKHGAPAARDFHENRDHERRLGRRAGTHVGVPERWLAREALRGLAGQGFSLVHESERLTREEARFVLNDLREADKVYGGGPDDPVDVSARAKIERLASEAAPDDG